MSERKKEILGGIYVVSIWIISTYLILQTIFLLGLLAYQLFRL